VGTGKSCLTALVIKSLSSEQAPERIAYFYCSKDTNRPHRSQTNDILRNIVAQLSSAKMDFILREFREHGEGKATLSTKDCTRLLSELVWALGGCTLIIDALDECSNPYDLLEALKTVSEDTKQLRIFISSRFEIKVASEFPEAFCVPITPEDNQKDIANYVNREIERRRNIINRRNRGEPEQMNDNLATELSEILQERAHSM
jgi:dsDNA-specific endonuclease/ATPase MutS2